jgi:hypothetical protein
MLIFQFCLQLVDLGFYKSKRSIGFLDNLMVPFLRSTRNTYIGSRDAGQRVSSIAYPLQRCGHLVLRCVLHGCLIRFPMGASFLSVNSILCERLSLVLARFLQQIAIRG